MRFIAGFLPQKRNSPNMKSSATVTAADTNNDPRQPNRFEKKKNIFYSRRTASHVRDAALDTPPGFGTSCTSPASSNRQTGKPFPRDRKRNVRSTARLFRAMWRTLMTTSEKSSFARRASLKDCYGLVGIACPNNFEAGLFDHLGRIHP
jgi:hypothetical protein